MIMMPSISLMNFWDPVGAADDADNEGEQKHCRHAEPEPFSPKFVLADP